MATESITSTISSWFGATTDESSAQGFYAPLITGRICGVGAHLGLVNPPSGKTAIVVHSFEPHTPAFRSGLQPGDVIVSVDGQAVQGRLLIPDDVAEMVRGPEGSQVEIVVERVAGLRYKYVLVREPIDVEAADLTNEGAGGNSLYLTETTASSRPSSPAKMIAPVTP